MLFIIKCLFCLFFYININFAQSLSTLSKNSWMCYSDSKDTCLFVLLLKMSLIWRHFKWHQSSLNPFWRDTHITKLHVFLSLSTHWFVGSSLWILFNMPSVLVSSSSSSFSNDSLQLPLFSLIQETNHLLSFHNKFYLSFFSCLNMGNCEPFKLSDAQWNCFFKRKIASSLEEMFNWWIKILPIDFWNWIILICQF